MFLTSLYECPDFTFEHCRQSAIVIPPQSFLLYSISIMVDGPAQLEVRCDEEHTRTILRRGDMIVAPYRLSIAGGQVGPCEFLQLHLKPSLIDRAAEELGSEATIVPVLGAVDPLAEQTVYQLDEALVRPEETREYSRMLVETLARHLVMNYSANAWPKECAGGFPKYLLRRTLDCANQNLDREVSIEEIARMVGVEADRFAHAFRASTGKSWQRYVNERKSQKFKAEIE